MSFPDFPIIDIQAIGVFRADDGEEMREAERLRQMCCVSNHVRQAATEYARYREAHPLAQPCLRAHVTDYGMM